MSSIREQAERITTEVAKICGCVWASCTKTRNATTDAIEKALRDERERCAKDVCGYCAGHFPPYDAKPAGPNAAGNWIHLPKKNGKPALCVANGIWSRMRFETATRKED